MVGTKIGLSPALRLRAIRPSWKCFRESIADTMQEMEETCRRAFAEASRTMTAPQATCAMRSSCIW